MKQHYCLAFVFFASTGYAITSTGERAQLASYDATVADYIQKVNAASSLKEVNVVDRKISRFLDSIEPQTSPTTFSKYETRLFDALAKAKTKWFRPQLSDSLNSQIKQGVTLKPAEKRPLPPRPVNKSDALLEQIKQNPALKPAVQRELAPRPVNKSPREALLSDIQKGAPLKKVGSVERQKIKPEGQQSLEDAVVKKQELINKNLPAKSGSLRPESEWE